MKQSISGPVAFIIVVVVLALIVGLGYYWMNRPQPVKGAAAKLMEAYRQGHNPRAVGPGGQPPPGVDIQSAPAPASSSAAQRMMQMYRAMHAGTPSGPPPSGSNP
ncbi:hypothetical protein CWRG_01417 [Chthonomonas calidirosea]|uniref:Uncharacterized protein n=1 Tax=Chthonomonas calidirosea (strain DSM 23976 / ICMP 18418 / T49) TaxID=1303518 RepID=S0F038_CHTCT|nr:hypothetical protein [Chthonomonas calidirosea]CCW36447.1 hypothetical protein CCALI_02657 [Chthonomonas calidirosea T49]CEK16225.1 hypothetical protein CWRG_01417 [Chthonomonas calidirosea]CEK17310.1 hypothetical protein CTKA_01434 [Chthonomonas calidirosea]